MTKLRVLTYNVRSMRDDRAALGRVISSVAADVVLVQEAPRFARWRSLCAELARRSGLVVVSGGRPAAANLILSNLSVDVLHTVDVKFSKDARLHQRGTAIAVLKKSDAVFAVAGTHLDVVESARVRHVGELHAAIAQHVPAGIPTIVGGDMNCHPGSAPYELLSQQRRDAFAVAGVGEPWTSKPGDPVQTLDYIFVDPSIEVVRAEVIQGPDIPLASDHRPVLAELELGSSTTVVG